jgi:hypothetical protein
LEALINNEQLFIRFIYVTFSGTPPFARPISPNMAAHTAHLDVSERQRYLDKISILGSDPYLLPPVFFSPLVSASSLPQINFHDIYIYLVHNPSPYTGESLKAFKSTDAYQYAVAGWVKDARVRHLATNNLYLIMAKVSTIYA